MSFIVFMILFVGVSGWLDGRIDTSSQRRSV